MNRIWLLIVLLYVAFGVWMATIPELIVPVDRDSTGKSESEPAVVE